MFSRSHLRASLSSALATALVASLVALAPAAHADEPAVVNAGADQAMEPAADASSGGADETPADAEPGAEQDAAPEPDEYAEQEGEPQGVAEPIAEDAAPDAATPPTDAAPDASAPEPQGEAGREAARSAVASERAAPGAPAQLDWGIKQSFRSYLLGPIAHGSLEMLGSATRDADMSNAAARFHWTSGTGSATENGASADLRFGAGNGVHFTGHEMTAGGKTAHALDMRFTNPRVKITSPSTATLYFDVRSREFESMSSISDDFFEQTNVDFATVDLSSAAFVRDGDSLTWTGASAELTANGSAAFGGFYEAGVDLDPLTFSAPVGDGTNPGGDLGDGSGAVATSTALTASKTLLQRGEQVRLTATIAPKSAKGSVVFTANGSRIGKAIQVKNGTAAVTTGALSVGAHRVRAEFKPTGAGFTGSASKTTVITVEAAAKGAEGVLQWGVKQSFRDYVVGRIAHGSIKPSKGAKQARGNGVFTFKQASGGSWNAKRGTGTVKYAGIVNFTGHDGMMDIDLANPVIRVSSASRASISVQHLGKTITLATIDLKSAKRTDLGDGAVRFSDADARLTAAAANRFFVNDTGRGPATPFYSAGAELDPVTFVIGEASKIKPVDPPRKQPVQGKKQTNSTTGGTAATSTAAGSLKWGISSYFAAYTTEKSKSPGCPTASKHCAGGSIETSGVGAGWLFPQAAGTDWNEKTQTGTVRYSGVVSFKGYGMTMYNVTNPTITVRSDSSATLSTGYSGSHGPSSVALDLSAATKTEGENGEVTWSGVPVQGGLSGISAGQGANFDSLSFTVGSEGGVGYGSTSSGGKDGEKRTAAAAPPTDQGITVLTAPERITAGGRIEFEAAGFEPDDESVLVVLYSDPVVLDEEARAGADGVVRWSGTLPDDISGEHTITLQGSIDAGAAITIIEADDTASPKSEQAKRGAAGAATTDAPVAALQTPAAAGVLPMPGMALWEWWTIAGGLAAIAACTTVLAIRQRREQRA